MGNSKLSQNVKVELETKKLMLKALSKLLLSNSTISKTQYDQMIKKIEKLVA